MRIPDFSFQPSKIYASLLITTFFLSIVIVLNLTVTVCLKLIIMIAVSIYLAHIFIRYILLKSQYSIIRLQLLSNDHWNIHTPTKCFVAQLRGDSTVTNSISILRFRINDNGKTISCVIFRDSLINREYRELLVCLRAMSHQVFEQSQKPDF